MQPIQSDTERQNRRQKEEGKNDRLVCLITKTPKRQNLPFDEWITQKQTRIKVELTSWELIHFEVEVSFRSNNKAIETCFKYAFSSTSSTSFSPRPNLYLNSKKIGLYSL